jgi:flagellar basal-body rod protein FlgF
MPNNAIRSLSRALAYHERHTELQSHNLANVNTDGFKAFRLTAERVDGQVGPRPVATLDLSQGSLRHTGRALDVALDGDAFLLVGTAGGQLLSRGGALRVDAGGMLVDGQGDPVLGVDGPIMAEGLDIEIQPDGTVVVDGEVRGRLVMAMAEPAALDRIGGGRMMAAGEIEIGVTGTTIRQRMLEEPNIDAINQMVSMIQTQRAHQAAHTALRTVDGVMGTITQSISRVR